MSIAIQLENVSKAYRIVRQKPFLAKEILRRILQRPSSVERHWALSDVSFEIEHGEAVGVIGTNGSGKSTLLSLIAKTSYPTTGTVTVKGRVGPLLELGAGFQGELTGFENIFLNASLLGLSKEDVEAKLEAIIEYSGLKEFIHSPIATYSTGMTARLGFSVIAHIEPEILLIDEILAVGDAAFRSKCQHTMQKFTEKGTTLFLVSHDLQTVQEMCSRVIWIDDGRMRAIGDAEEVIELYRNPTADSAD